MDNGVKDMPYAKAQMQSQVKRVISQVKEAIYAIVGELSMTAWVTPEPVPYRARMTGVKKVLQIGERWGKPWDCAWFHFTGEIPRSAAGKKVVLLIDVGGEACLVDGQGSPVQGLTNANSEFDHSLGTPGKRVVFFTNRAGGGEPIDLWADAGTNDLFGKYRDNGTVQAAYIGICDDPMKALYYDLEYLFELMSNLPENSARHDSILFTLYDAAMILDQLAPEEVSRACAAARMAIVPEMAKKAADPSLIISALGHSHIDLAWLWPIRETIRKGARTFSTALMMMEHYPDYIFGASQPQLYQWVKSYYPSLFERIKPRVREGRWETLGAMWVEADTNLPGGESLVRQILYGQRFFQKEFNQEPKMLWLPDSFGFNAALPQILKKSGVDFFLTIKLSWNLFDQYPHHTFIWKGIDGSSVLAHMPPEGTYNSSAAPRAIVKSEADYLDKGISDHCLVVFGIGDGGGGPGEEHLEMLKREKNSAGLPPVRQETAEEFFRKLAEKSPEYRFWQGELYLERHQGTYTTQARSKRYNRKIEIALHDLEFYATIAMVLAGAVYPAGDIESIWKEVLLYQFHDIMAGSSIARVYQESSARYDLLLERTGDLRERALKSLFGMIHTGSANMPALILNPTSWERGEWLKINHNWYPVRVPAMGYTVIDLAYPAKLPGEMGVDTLRLENDKLLVNLAVDGTLAAVFDKENQRQVLEAPGNRLAVFNDDGDAWDIPIGYADRPPEYFRLIKVATNIDGPRASIQQTYSYGNSVLEQEIVLVHGSRRIDFITKADWRERQKMLRTSFPVNVQNTEATCEIQFGTIRRPTHRNTTWDMAKFEICAHKWIDLSDTGHGVALLNDCKYGHKVYENSLDINLLRSPVYPDPEADWGTHEFTYALYPHEGNCSDGKVVQAGYELNIPLMVVPVVPNTGGKLPESSSFITVEPGNIIVETIKKAEDSHGVIIRLFECAGRETIAKLDIRFPFKALELVNLMEERCEQSKLQAGAELFFAAYEIHTLKLIF
jgi:alpha-mannosidase